jgi:hypothetical protein
MIDAQAMSDTRAFLKGMNSRLHSLALMNRQRVFSGV